MNALHDAGSVATALPTLGTFDLSSGQVEPRAVEPTEHGTLNAADEREAAEASASPVLNLVRDFAESFSEMVVSSDEPDAEATVTGAYFGESVGRELDLYV